MLPTPTVDKDFIVTPEFNLLIAISGKLLDDGKTSNTLLLGPAGCGKTGTAQQLAAHLELPYLHMNCALIREASMLFGTREVKEGRTYTRASMFTQAVEKGNVVIMLDEINRASPMALNGLLSIMDGSSPYSDDLERHINAEKNIIFIGACNIGSAYTGTFKLDKALDDRFSRRMEVGYLEPAQEKQLLVAKTGINSVAAQRLIKIANKVRTDYNKGGTFTQDISTRLLLEASKDFAILESVRPGSGPKSLSMTIANRFGSSVGDNDERKELAVIIDGQFSEWKGTEVEKEKTETKLIEEAE